MSASLTESDWNFRILDKRLVVVKTKSESIRKVAVLDVVTNLMFTVQVPQTISSEQLTANYQYLFNLKVYTSKNIENVERDFVSFFEAIDIYQEMEDFLKAYWVYPKKIRFELAEVEEP
jgi:hypothetical protein